MSVFTADDNDLNTKTNQKTFWIGTADQFANLSVTYPGQVVFIRSGNSTTSGVYVDKMFIRNAANDAWLPKALTENAEESQGRSDGGTNTGNANTRYYEFFTLPTTYKFYLITGIEWQDNGTAQTVCGVELVDANPPTLAASVLVALGQTKLASAGVLRQSNIGSNMIRGGTLIGVFIHQSASAGFKRFTTGSSVNKTKAITFTQSPPTQDTNAWAAATDEGFIKVYYRGYS